MPNETDKQLAKGEELKVINYIKKIRQQEKCTYIPLSPPPIKVQSSILTWIGRRKNLQRVKNSFKVV